MSGAHPGETRQPSPPDALRKLQEGFGRCVREPLDFATGRMLSLPDRFQAATVERILPRGAQPAGKRLAIYNEQYWYRLLTVLQEDFPLVARLLGFWEFNRLAMGYLYAYPSRAPYLEGLPWEFPAFLRLRSGSGGTVDERLVRAADIDLAAFRAFHASGLPPLDPGRMPPEAAQRLGSIPLGLQPWLTLVEEDENLVEFRRSVVDGSPGEGGAGLPAIGPVENRWAVSRRAGVVEWIFLSGPRFNLLRQLAAGETLESACDAVAGELPEAEADAFAGCLVSWFAEWTALGWFVHPVEA